MTTRRRVTIDIGREDWRFLASLASALELSPEDTLYAFWKIGASAYAAQRLGYELRLSLMEFSPERLRPLWQEWLERQQP